MCVMSLNECKRNEEKFFSPRRAATWSDGYISHNSAPLQKRRLLTTTTTAREREREAEKCYFSRSRYRRRRRRRCENH